MSENSRTLHRLLEEDRESQLSLESARKYKQEKQRQGQQQIAKAAKDLATTYKLERDEMVTKNKESAEALKVQLLKEADDEVAAAKKKGDDNLTDTIDKIYRAVLGLPAVAN